MNGSARIDESECVIRGTGSRKGRTRWLCPASAPVRYLHYGRIILDAGVSCTRFSNHGQETGLICLRGRCVVQVSGGASFEMGLYDAVYVPRDESIEAAACADGCDLAEISAPVDHRYPVQFVPFDSVRANPELSFPTGGESYSRHVNIVLGKNTQAGRILAGVTFSAPGNWTSWPPHEHGETLEEAYVFIDMPAPAWGVQFVYTDPGCPEVVTAVREGDCVVMPAGYHPNVAAPGGRIGFLWIMAAHREGVDREFGMVHVQPEYGEVASGLETGRTRGV